jgi:energy-coupling factor transporter ATP-binding protein EcfA2
MLLFVSIPSSEYRRTAIRKLSIRRYRSLENVVLDDLPDLIVIYGPNGSGKSNLLRAVQLALRAAAIPDVLPMKRQDAMTMQLQEADQKLDLRPDDFRFGALPEIRVGLSIDIGSRVQSIFSLTEGTNPGKLDLEVIFQLDGTRSIRFWFEQAQINGYPGGFQSFPSGDLIRSVLFRRLVQTSAAYRVPGAHDSPEHALYAAIVSEEPEEREAAHRFGLRLASAGLFGETNADISIIPVESRTYGEKQVRLRHPIHGELSLRNLGSGEQQLVLLLAQQVITPFPITQIEEPEAHLHLKLMEKLAPILRESVLGDGGTPDVDQLWMATHHHLFAISDEFFDVSLDQRGSTSVIRRKRDEVAKHFYEPSPYWDTLRTLVESGLNPESIVSLDDQGKPITAKQVLESIRGDRVLANQFVKAATEAFVLSLAKDGSDS